MTHYSSGSAASLGLASCHRCGKLSDIALKRCGRCHSTLRLRIPNSIQKTLALLITGLIFFIPANLFPIMHSEQLGVIESATIVGGVIILWEQGSYPIAIVVFVASVIVPIAKFIILFWLCYSVHFNPSVSSRERTVLYRVTEFIGRWSMVDVFVVAILVALIQLGGVLNVRPGLAALTFACAVIFTMFAAMCFDPRLLWDKLANNNVPDSDTRNIKEL